MEYYAYITNSSIFGPNTTIQPNSKENSSTKKTQGSVHRITWLEKYKVASSAFGVGFGVFIVGSMLSFSQFEKISA
jgi:hypothetical protein